MMPSKKWKQWMRWHKRGIYPIALVFTTSIIRDGAINQLIDTINELSHIFKQLNQLVIDQGTLLDRIDYNIEQTVHQTRKANKQLKKVRNFAG